MVTDTKRILRTDPGRPEVCNVCQLHRFFGDDWEEIQDGERTARTGCVDTKKLLAQRIIDHYAPARERYAELMANPSGDRRDPRGRRGPPQAQGEATWTRSHAGWAPLTGRRSPRAHARRRLRPCHRTSSPIASAGCSTRSSSWGPSRSRSSSSGSRGSVFYAFGDILLLFFLAWLLSFALLPLISFVARIPRVPPAAAVIIVYLTIVVLAARDHRPGLGDDLRLDQQFIETRRRSSRASSRSCSPTSSRAWRRSACAVDLVSQVPTIVANLQEWAAQLVGPLQSLARRQHRRVRQRAAARDPVDLHRRRPRGHPRVPLPARAAGVRAPGAGAAGRGRAVVRRVPARPADHGPGVRRVHRARQHRCSGCRTRRSRRSPPACSR